MIDVWIDNVKLHTFCYASVVLTVQPKKKRSFEFLLNFYILCFKSYYEIFRFWDLQIAKFTIFPKNNIDGTTFNFLRFET